MNLIDVIERENLKKEVPQFNVGDTVKVFVKVVEGDKERLQAFEGVVISRKNGGIRETFTVRKISYGVGVEKTFLMHSPLVEKVEVIRVGDVNRAKLYYLRDRVGKAAKTKELVGANLKRDAIVIKEEVPGESEVAESAETAEVAEAPVEEAPATEEAAAEEAPKAE